MSSWTIPQLLQWNAMVEPSGRFIPSLISKGCQNLSHSRHTFPWTPLLASSMKLKATSSLRLLSRNQNKAAKKTCKFLLLRISYSMEDFSVSVLFLEPKHLGFCFKVNSPNSTKCLLQQSTPGLPFQQKHLLLLLPMLKTKPLLGIRLMNTCIPGTSPF